MVRGAPPLAAAADEACNWVCEGPKLYDPPRPNPIIRRPKVTRRVTGSNSAKLPKLSKRWATSRTVDILLGAGGETGALHHAAWQPKFEAKESDASRNGSRWGVVAGGRRVRSSRWSAERYSDREHGSYSL